MQSKVIKKKFWAVTKKKNTIFVFIFFALFFFSGIFIFKDYGISCDETIQRQIGMMNIRYITQGDPQLITDNDRYHGPFFEMFLCGVEIIWNRLDSNNYMDIRNVYLVRHFITFFAFFISLIFFYLLCKDHLDNWKMGLLGSLLLILSPRIFSHAFYNSKDLPLLSFFIISIYTLVKFLDKKNLIRAFLHALVCAILIDIRITGIFVPFLTFLLMATDFMWKPESIKHKLKKMIPSFICYGVVLIIFTILFWPILWEGPLYHLKEAFKDLSHHIWYLDVLYLGKYISAADVPWHYIPVWLIITTPVLYILFFVTGLFFTIRSFFSRFQTIPLINKQGKNNFIFLLWFFLPLFAVITLRSVLYDSWRHMFFIYPAFLLITLNGINNSYIWFRSKLKGRTREIAISLFGMILLGALSHTLYFMVRYHPYQNIYFNCIAGKDMISIKQKFELDYWGLSYKEALEYIIKHDEDQTINLYFDSFCGKNTFFITLPTEQRKRLQYVDNLDEAKYFLSNYRWHREEYPFNNEFYSIHIGDATIMVVYKLKE